MSPSVDTSSSDLHELASRRLARVLGGERGPRVLDEVLGTLGLARISSPDELLAVSHALAQRGPIEAAVGGLLGVDAVVRGAASDVRRP